MYSILNECLLFWCCIVNIADIKDYVFHSLFISSIFHQADYHIQFLTFFSASLHCAVADLLLSTDFHWFGEEGISLQSFSLLKQLIHKFLKKKSYYIMKIEQIKEFLMKFRCTTNLCATRTFFCWSELMSKGSRQ